MNNCTRIADFLINNNGNIKLSGLMNGKAGVSIFFYHLSKITNDKKYVKHADSLLEQVYRMPNLLTNFENGIAGVGWCVEYLVQNNMCRGDADEILEDIDNQIFKLLNEQDNLGLDLQNGILGYLQYIIMRLKNKKRQNNEFEINAELFKLVIDRIDLITPNQLILLTKDVKFDLFNRFFILLLTLNQSLKLDIYNVKIQNMLKQWEVYFNTYLPSIHLNRLYLAVCLHQINQSLKLISINKQIEVLLFSIDSEILKSEIDFQKAINPQLGLIGVALLFRFSNIFFDSEDNYSRIKPIHDVVMEQLSKKITKIVEAMDSMIGISDQEMRDLGLSTGLAGAGLILTLYPDLF